tara:strand:- start:394 stop:870 length:477 start_codon:yes stop_codon:yes gene_type:complete
LVELCERATTIQRVRVLSAEAEQGERLERPALVTRLRFEVLDVLAGEERAELVVFGGRLGEEAAGLSGQPVLVEGQELLLFLHNQETQSPYLGLWQGVYRLRPKGTYREGRALLDVTRAGELAFVRDNEPALEVEVFLDEVRRLLAELEARGEAEAGS